MKTFTVKIETTNDAFQESEGLAEIARLLRGVAECVEAGQLNGTLADLNGNRVGFYAAE